MTTRLSAAAAAALTAKKAKVPTPNSEGKTADSSEQMTGLIRALEKSPVKVLQYLEKTPPAQFEESFNSLNYTDKINVARRALNIIEHFREGQDIRNKLFQAGHPDEYLDIVQKTQKSFIDSLKDFLRDMVRKQYTSKGMYLDEPALRSLTTKTLLFLIKKNSQGAENDQSSESGQSGQNLVPPSYILKHAPNYSLGKLRASIEKEKGMDSKEKGMGMDRSMRNPT